MPVSLLFAESYLENQARSRLSPYGCEAVSLSALFVASYPIAILGFSTTFDPKHCLLRMARFSLAKCRGPLAMPTWVQESAEAFSRRIQPLLTSMPSSLIASRIGVTRWYAGRIRQGCRPHPRHWPVLAELVGISSELMFRRGMDLLHSS
jgi:hypothetical protein